jgi:hypothetical protein
VHQSSFGVKPGDSGVPVQAVRERFVRATKPWRSRMAWMVLQAGTFTSWGKRLRSRSRILRAPQLGLSRLAATIAASTCSGN